MTKLDDAYQELETLPPSDFDACASVLRQFLELQGGRQDRLIHIMARTFETSTEMADVSGRLVAVRAAWYREAGRKIPSEPALESLPI